jgi:hypothetical protein
MPPRKTEREAGACKDYFASWSPELPEPVPARGKLAQAGGTIAFVRGTAEDGSEAVARLQCGADTIQSTISALHPADNLIPTFKSHLCLARSAGAALNS